MERRVSHVIVVAVLGAVAGCGMLSPKKAETKAQVKVEKGAITIQVVESGYLQAFKAVEVKSRVSGRVKKLYVDEGDIVQAGQLIAEIDPQETEFQVAQNAAQVRGAEAGVRRSSVELAQRRVTATNAVAKAESALRQLDMERKAQPTLTSTAVRSAASALEQAQMALSQLESVTHPNARTAAETALADAKASSARADNELDRQRRLLEKGYVAKRDVEAAEVQVQLESSRVQSATENLQRLTSSQANDKKQAVERVEQAQADLDRAKANGIQDGVKREQYLQAQRTLSDARAQLRDVDAIEAGRAQQAASVDQLRTVLRDGQRQLQETRIVAPVSGVVTKRYVQVGELVASLNSFSAGSPIFRVEDQSRMLVKLDINEIDVAKLALGQKADIVVDAFISETFHGKVTKLAPTNTTAGQAAVAGQDTVVKYGVEVTLDTAPRKLKSGMSAKVTMKVVDKPSVLRVPLDYLGSDAKGDYLMVLTEKESKDPKAKGTRESVKSGLRSGTHAEILSGATDGQILAKPEFTGPARKGMMSFGPDDGESEESSGDGQGQNSGGN